MVVPTSEFMSASLVFSISLTTMNSESAMQMYKQRRNRMRQKMRRYTKYTGNVKPISSSFRFQQTSFIDPGTSYLNEIRLNESVFPPI
jgi:hypothetical protein